MVLYKIEARRLREMNAALPMIEYRLAKLDWNEMAKKAPDPLSARAKELMAEARRAMLAPFAPTHVLNELFEVAAQPKAEPLTGMSVRAARGIVALVNRGVSHADWLKVWRDFPAIEARAK